MDQIDIHKEIVEEAINDDSEQGSGKRVFFVIFSILIIIGLILAFTAGGGLNSFIRGRLASTTVDEYRIITKQGDIVILGDVYGELREQFNENEEHEWAACLIGTRKADTIRINKLYLPKIFDQSVFSVRSERCPPNTIITLHSHPPDRCVFSDQDLKSYEEFLKINPSALTAIMCAEDRFTIYNAG